MFEICARTAVATAAMLGFADTFAHGQYAPELGLGGSNYGRYSNPKLDKVFREAMVTMDPVKREELLHQTVKIALEDLPNIPLHFESSVRAFRKGSTYEGRADQYTLASSVHSTK